MEHDTRIYITTKVRRSQHGALRKIATLEVPLQEHMQRALDMYLSQPAIMKELEQRGVDLGAVLDRAA